MCLLWHRDWYVGLDSNWLTRAQVRQMAGRAGRAGLDDSGEAILFTNARNPQQAEEIGRLIQVRCDSTSRLFVILARQAKEIGCLVRVQWNSPHTVIMFGSAC
jgi:hypothetical protein